MLTFKEMRASLLLLALFASPSAFPGPKPETQIDLKLSGGKVEFEAVGNPSALKIHGRGAAPEGALKVSGTQLEGEAKFQLSTLETGMKMRDRHMKEKYLQVDQFPEAQLTLNSAEITKNLLEAKESTHTAPFTGQLTLHGVTRPVAGTLLFSRNPTTLTVDAKFPVKLTDFQIGIPSFAGITVAESIQVYVQTQTPYEPSKK